MENKVLIAQEIVRCLGELKDTDYKAIKFAEGELSEAEYAPIRELRRQWRVEINRLEKELENLPN